MIDIRKNNNKVIIVIHKIYGFNQQEVLFCKFIALFVNMSLEKPTLNIKK